jgi:hypothetical protein
MRKEPKNYQISGEFKQCDLVMITVGRLKNKIGFIIRRLTPKETPYDSVNHYSILIDNTVMSIYSSAMRLISRVNR